MWLSLRQPYEQFWCLSPREILRIVEGIGKAEEREIARDHYRAQLMALAFHEPDKIPEMGGAKGEVSAARRAEIEEIEVRAALQAMAGGR